MEYMQGKNILRRDLDALTMAGVWGQCSQNQWLEPHQEDFQHTGLRQAAGQVDNSQDPERVKKFSTRFDVWSSLENLLLWTKVPYLRIPMKDNIPWVEKACWMPLMGTDGGLQGVEELGTAPWPSFLHSCEQLQHIKNPCTCSCQPPPRSWFFGELHLDGLWT